MLSVYGTPTLTTILSRPVADGNRNVARRNFLAAAEAPPRSARRAAYLKVAFSRVKYLHASVVSNLLCEAQARSERIWGDTV